MNSMLLFAGPGHTVIRNVAPLTTAEPIDEAAAAYWYELANKPDPVHRPTPFIAMYVAGEYLVTDIAPDPDIQSKVETGMTVVSVNGVPVREYVATHRGERTLLWDPARRRVYEQRLCFPKEAPFMIVFRGSDGSLVEYEISWSTESWTVGSRQMPFLRTRPVHRARCSTGIDNHTVPDVFVEPSFDEYLAYVSLIRETGFIPKPDPSVDTVLRACLELVVGDTSGRPKSGP